MSLELTLGSLPIIGSFGTEMVAMFCLVYGQVVEARMNMFGFTLITNNYKYGEGASKIYHRSVLSLNYLSLCRGQHPTGRLYQRTAS